MRVFRAAGLLIALAVVVTALAGPASAAADGSGYGQWTAGSLTVPLAGFPSATVTTNSTHPQVGGGTSAFLGSSTPFGSAYGTSQGKQYLVLGAASGGPSTTTVSFAMPPPTGWGFALGDIDADTVRVAATGTGGPVSATDLGWQSAFNYCQSTPRPTSCTGGGPFTDVPSWDPGTATLTGNILNTAGASGWFRPTVPIKSLTLTFTVQAGIPSYQIWVAALPVSIAGTVRTACAHPAPRTTVRLLAADGSPVLDAAGDPVTTTTGANGEYSFTHLASGGYLVAADAAHGYTAGSSARRAVRASTDVAGTTLTLSCPAEPAAEPAPPVTVDVLPGTPVLVKLPVGLVATHVDQPDHGDAEVNPNGTITYTPDAGFTGTDHIHYTARTRSGTTVTGVVTVRITLAATGVMVLPLVGLGGALVVAGALALFVRRRIRS